MTLVIGLKTSGFSISSADSQMNHVRVDLYSKNISRRSLTHKLKVINNNLVLAFLGAWDDPDKISYEASQKRFPLCYLSKYTKKLDKDAIVLVFCKFISIQSFIFKGIKSHKLEKKKFPNNIYYFNEPNSEIPGYPSVEQNINNYAKGHKDSLDNYLFIINNTILTEVVQGENLNIRGQAINNNLNYVGGYVTIMILMKTQEKGTRPLEKSVIYNLFSAYNNSTLLDGITDPFTTQPEQKKIKYIDNLSMIFRACINHENEGIKIELIDWLKMQVEFLVINNHIACYLINEIIDHINRISNLNIDNINCPECDEQIVIPDAEELEIDFFINFFNH